MPKFVDHDPTTPVTADWLNGVDTTVNTALAGATTPAAARTALGVSASGATLQVANNLSDVANAAAARSNLGVTATGADPAYNLKSANLSDVANAATARTNLGVTATGADTTYSYRANNLSDLANAATARSNLGLGTLATINSPVPVANGGTAQTTYTDGQLLIGNSIGNTLTKATLTAGTNITITNGNGAITIDAAAIGTGADYTPTINNLANITSSSVIAARYMRCGSTVTVSGTLNLQITSGASTTTVGVSFPVASTINSSADVTGHIMQFSDSLFTGNTSLHRAECTFTSAGSGFGNYSFIFMYTVK